MQQHKERLAGSAVVATAARPLLAFLLAGTHFGPLLDPIAYPSLAKPAPPFFLILR
jgi:hypothetical protein